MPDRQPRFFPVHHALFPVRLLLVVPGHVSGVTLLHQLFNSYAMKTSIKLLALASLFMIVSCSKSTDETINPDSKTGQVTGSFKVTSYLDSGKDETTDYSAYSFSFNSDGTFTASAGSAGFAGSWQLGNSGSDDDNSSNRLLITITGNKQMDDLSHNWLIVSLDNTTIHLVDDNPASMEEITFTRNNQ